MDVAKRVRSVQRGLFTKCYSSFLEKCGNAELTATDRLIALELLESRMIELEAANTKYIELLLSSVEDERLIGSEIESHEKYKVNLLQARASVKSSIPDVTPSQTQGNVPVISATRQSEKPFKRPTFEIPKFSGHVSEWLQFWSHFRKVHDDPGISNEDKLEYLKISVVKGSKAESVVDGYPITGDNYKKAFDSLKSRFGRDELLVEYYTRELLSLVLQNAACKGKNVSLSSIYDKVTAHIRALETLGVTTDNCTTMLYPLVESSLPEEILRTWQRSPASSDAGAEHAGTQNRLSRLLGFLKLEVENEERINMAVTGFSVSAATDKREQPQKIVKPKTSSSTEIPSASVLLSSEEKRKKCIFCDGEHDNSVCEKAKKMSIDTRKNVIKENNCCFRCLIRGHRAKDCKVKITCGWCGNRHSTLICSGIGNAENRVTSEKTKLLDKCDKNLKELNLANFSDFPDVYLKTLRALLYSDSKEFTARVVIDEGSHRSYIRAEVAQFLGYEPLGDADVVHSLFGGVKSNKSSHKVFRVRAKDLAGSFACNFEAMDQPVLCDELSRVKRAGWYAELAKRDICLSDLEDARGNSDAPIDVLIGADIAGKLLTGNRVELSCGLCAIETKLGWTIMGKVLPTVRRDPVVKSVSMFVSQAKISDLWELDVLGIRDPIEKSDRLSKEKNVQENFLKTVRLSEDLRYMVDLPWIEEHAPVSHNFELARKRLENTIRKLKSDGLMDEYNQVFQEWLTEGVIEVLPQEESSSTGHFLPHRPVVKEGSTTKIRPVFDASAYEKGFPSLNTCLEKGPNFIELIPAILLRFRENEYAVLADIRRAFLQIEVNEWDRDFLRFLWYINGILRILRHKRLVFGLTCSPFLLAAVINFHLESIRRAIIDGKITQWSLQVVERLKRAFYVDNVATSVKSVEELNVFVSQSKEILAAGSFDLRGWEHTHDVSTKEVTSVLGLLYNKSRDTLSINASIWKDFSVESVTKRSILSAAHKVFDPIGLTSPVTLLPKLMLKKLWREKTGWDDSVNESTRAEFLQWYEQLHLLGTIEIPRKFGKGEFSIHTFCDASDLAYASVTFLRVQNESGIELIFLSAKSRVSPVSLSKKKSRTDGLAQEKTEEKATTPRLELLAACIGSRQTREIVDALGYHDIPTFYWSDSTTVLAWMNRDIQWNIFVWNRVREIRDLTSSGSWRYVPGGMNPADLPSRGCQAKELLARRWWEGPSWLRKDEKFWPNATSQSDETEISREMKKPHVSLLNVRNPTQFDVVKKFSSYSKMIRFFTIMLRFKNYVCKKENPRGKRITLGEIHEVELKFLTELQKEMFVDVRDPRLSALQTYRHTDGLIRVKTRIVERNDEFQFLFPILLDSHHEAVRLLILETHESMCHAGVQSVMCQLRERFWIVSMRKAVRAVLAKCVICKRQNAKPIQVVTAPLPLHRVEDTAVFEGVGVDLAGPVYLRGQEKAWICLYTCAVYRAVHLELLTSLSTQAFLGGFRRFIGRRGRPTVVYSDNGTNFVGANNALARLDWDVIAKYSSAKRVDWRFNPPTAAWWGGWWERLIGMMKQLLRKVLGKSCVTYEEMTTILCDCELVLNSRPLTYISDDINDLKPLTPAMFLHENRSSEVPDHDLLYNLDLNSRFKRKQEIMEHLRSRFRREYLSQLVAKNNVREEREVRVGEVVLIGDDNQKRIDWPLAKIEKLIPGRDNRVRVVILRCKDGVLKRPIQRVYPLEILNDDNSESKCLRRKIVETTDSVSNSDAHANPTIESVERISSPELECEKEGCSRVDAKTRRGRTIVKPRRYV